MAFLESEGAGQFDRLMLDYAHERITLIKGAVMEPPEGQSGAPPAIATMQVSICGVRTFLPGQDFASPCLRFLAKKSRVLCQASLAAFSS